MADATANPTHISQQPGGVEEWRAAIRLISARKLWRHQ
jgi:hypothetical protein